VTFVRRSTFIIFWKIGTTSRQPGFFVPVYFPRVNITPRWYWLICLMEMSSRKMTTMMSVMSPVPMVFSLVAIVGSLYELGGKG